VSAGVPGSGAAPSRRLMTIAEAADDLGIGVTTVRRLIRARRLPAVRLFAGGDLRIRPSDLTTFVNSLETEQEAGLRLVYGTRKGRR
jgi:excisionase family DNA binding protein